MRKFLLSNLLLLYARFSQSLSSDSLVITQTPDVSVQEGETRSISCCWKGTPERVDVKWLKSQTLIENQRFINQSISSQNEQGNTCSVLIFARITYRDSGRYICKVSVEIPVLVKGEGNGTTITVTARETPGLFSEILAVTQSPDVSVVEGETGRISCCWPGTAQRVGVKWMKNQTLIKDETVISRFRVSQNESAQTCSVLTFAKITSRDSGRYVCRVSVEVPVLTEIKGNGTTITVTAREIATTSTEKGFPSDVLVVTQSPDVSVQEGETENISCCWMGKAQGVGVKWLKDQTLIKYENVVKQSTISQSDQANTFSVLTFSKIKSRDSGRYVCKVSVEFPHLTEIEGNGTIITVTARETSNNAEAGEISDVTLNKDVIFALRCLPLLILITAFLLFHCLHSKALKDIEDSAAYENEAIH